MSETVQPNETQTNEKQPTNWILVGVLAVVLIVLVYYGYQKFNTNKDYMAASQEAERDDPVADFNLREAIRDLQNKQAKVMKTLSSMSEY
jgi:hypothetical protein